MTGSARRSSPPTPTCSCISRPARGSSTRARSSHGSPRSRVSARRRRSSTSRRSSRRRAAAPTVVSSAASTCIPRPSSRTSARSSAAGASSPWSTASRRSCSGASWPEQDRRLADTVTVISPKGALTAVGMVPKMRRYTVAGTFEVGMYEFDASFAYLALPVAQEFAGLAGVTGIEVKLADAFDAKRVGRAVVAALGFPYWVRDWMDMNRSLFAALQLEKLALFVIVTIIVLVAAVAVIGHLVLLVAEKRKEIGVLKAIGASRQSVTATFFAVGMAIGVAGTGAGSVVGLLIIWGQNTYKGIRLASDVYQIDYLPMKLTLSDGLMVIGATLFLSFLATIIPARRAGALEPVDVLRYE